MRYWLGKVVLAGVAGFMLTACQTVSNTSSSTPGLMDTQSLASTSGTFPISLTTNSSTVVHVGARMSFKVSSSVSGYGHLYILNTSGKVDMLAENMMLKPGVGMSYPPQMDHLTLVANPPAGDNHILFLVTRSPFAGLGNSQGRTVTRPMTLPSYTPESFREQYDATVAALPEGSWSRTEIVVRVNED